MIDLSKLTQAPWHTAECYGDYNRVLSGYLDIPDIGAGKLDREDAEFIILARNAFDVLMRHKTWQPFWIFDDVWIVKSNGTVVTPPGDAFEWSDPFTALVEADKWYKENS